MMRVPGTHGSPLEHKARGTDVRIVYSPADALADRAERIPRSMSCSLPLALKPRRPPPRSRLMRAKAEGIQNFSVFCNHVTIIPAIRAILDSPDMRLDGFIGPGHVSTVIGCRPYEWIARNEGKPVVTSGFEPLDLLQSIVMLLRQLRAGEAKVENQYKRVVPWEGNRAALKAMAEVFRAASLFRVARPGIHLAIGLADSRQVCRMGCRAALPVPGTRVDRPQSRAMRRSAERCFETRTMQTVWQGVHAGTSHRRAHGFIGGLMRSILQLRTSQGRDGDSDQLGGMTGQSATETPRAESASPQGPLPRPADRNGARRRRQSQPQAGGGPVCAAALSPFTRTPGRRRSRRIRRPRVAITTDSFVVKPLRFPGGSIGELAVNGTVNDLAVSGAKGQAHGRHVCPRRRTCPRQFSKPKFAPWRCRCKRAGVAMVGGDTKVVERGKADGMYITTTGIGRPIPGVHVDARISPRRDKVLLSGPIGDHGITILLARGDLDLEADLCSDTRSVLPLVEAMAARRRRREFAGCAIPPAAVLQLRSTNWRAIVVWASILSRRGDPDARRGARRLRIAWPRSPAHRQ